MSFLETLIDTGASRSGGIIENGDLESGVMTTGTGAHHAIEAITTVEEEKNQAVAEV